MKGNSNFFVHAFKNPIAVDFSTSPIGKEPNVLGIDQQRVKKRVKRDLLDADFTPNDPLYEYMWYMNPDFEDRNENAVTNVDSDIRHMNVTGAWALGNGFKRSFFSVNEMNPLILSSITSLATNHLDSKPSEKDTLAKE